jgi:hypothetical protein
MINILFIYDTVLQSDMRIQAFQMNICLHLQVETLN